MLVAVTGATGVLGRAAVPALVAAGHTVRGSARTGEGAAALRDLGAEPRPADVLVRDSLLGFFEGAEVVVNLATRVPSGIRAGMPGAFRENDRLRTRGAATVVAAAHTSGVRCLVQESVSFVYADNGDDWIDETHHLDITPATEPAAVSESHAQDFGSGQRTSVVLRFGTVVGDDPLTRFQLRSASQHRGVGIGRPDTWTHLVHTDDVGPALVAALHAPSGVYNVGAEPVLRRDLMAGYASAAGVDEVGYLGGVVRRLAGTRLEPLARSLRVSSESFSSLTGWAPVRPTFDACWLESAARHATQGTGRG